MISFKGAHFPQDIILTGVRWYVAYPLSYPHSTEFSGGEVQACTDSPPKSGFVG